ncbi:MAG: ADP-ribosylglycohydrolase family protein [Phycisphaerales bacterium]|nr:MAG: ADP-ribosylglycohydrolase family protein [Phycisphaerales bacterium]
MDSWRAKAGTTLLSLLMVASLQLQAEAERTISAEELHDKVRGMWLGQLIGNAAGRETEGEYSGPTPNPNPVVPWVIKQQWDADDDTDTEYVALHIIETYGLDCNSLEIAGEWRTHTTASRIYIANKQAWYLMGDGYLPPDTGSRTYNKHWYAIDSQISTEVLGAVSPGLVQPAIDLAGKFARVTNTGFPVHASQFYAAIYAEAFFEPSVVTLVERGLRAVPVTSRTYQVITDVLEWYFEDVSDGMLDWRATRSRLYDKYQGANSHGRFYRWVESTVNTGATVIAILYGQGDFKETVQIGVLAGWDCDCNPATAGGLIGIVNGFSGLPPDLADPSICGDLYINVARPYLPDPDRGLPQYEAVSRIASCLTYFAQQNILDNGGYYTSDGVTRVYHVPDAGVVVPEPEMPDPNRPAGLVAQALAAGIAVTPTAAVQRYDADVDRDNLYSIIDGIIDNSYNGHKAYYSYVSDPKARPKRDWYQLDFSQPVKFEQVTFYEGDVVWHRINDYHKDDDSLGGFFEDLTVEVLRHGRWVEPAALQMTPALDRLKMYQTIAFDFPPIVGEAIRVIGTPGGARGFTTIMELEAQGQIDPGLYVADVRIAGGQTQRSHIGSIEIELSRDVSVSRDDVLLEEDALGAVPMSRFGFRYDPATRSLILLLSPTLPDGRYSVRLRCATITDATGLTLLDDDDDPADGTYTIRFHKLFGDVDGSATVDFRDMSFLAGHWLSFSAGTGLESNGDDVLNFLDLAPFTANWLSRPQPYP